MFDEQDSNFDNHEFQSGPKYMTRVQLMDQGTFGCIYRPEIDCDSGNMGESIYVSKVQMKTKTVQNEIDIGNLVKQIPHYMYHFSPILKTCPIEFSTLQKYEKPPNETCDILNKDNGASATKQFISSKIRYVGIYIIDYLNRIPTQICTQKIITTYYYLDMTLDKLWNHGIIHNDIKDNNVLYDEYNHSPNIIDFGISFKIDSLNDMNMQPFIFYTEKYYPYWCIHIYILCQIVNRKIQVDQPIQQNVLMQIYDLFMEQFREFMGMDIIDYDDLAKHKNAFLLFIQPLIGKSWENDLKPLLLATHRLWDKYSLAITYLNMISKIDSQSILVPNLFIKHLKSIIFTI
jgi:serine/threonine protein kinase